MQLEYRAVADVSASADGNTIMGWACRFNEPADLGMFVERVMPAAFTRTLNNGVSKVRLLAGHSAAALPVGTIDVLEQRAEGLWLEARVADTAVGKDIKTLAREGHPVGLSIGFSVPSGGDSWSNDHRERTLTEIRLHEVSVVGAPAYDNADIVGIRSLDSLLSATASLRVGKKLSAASADSLKAAVATLMGMLSDAGVDTADLADLTRSEDAAEVETIAEDTAEPAILDLPAIDLDALAAKAAVVLDEVITASAA